MSKRRLIHKAVHTSGLGSTFEAKVYRDSEWNEWQVEFKRNGVQDHKATYHASDKHDAVCTANYHIGRMAAQFA